MQVSNQVSFLSCLAVGRFVCQNPQLLVCLLLRSGSVRSWTVNPQPLQQALTGTHFNEKLQKLLSPPGLAYSSGRGLVMEKVWTPGGGTKGYVPEEHPLSPPALVLGRQCLRRLFAKNASRLHPWILTLGRGATEPFARGVLLLSMQ